MQQSSSFIKKSVLAFLTDFGSVDGYVGVMKGVVLSIISDAHLIDITHEVPPQRVAAGAWALKTSYRYFPADTIYVCVVDPGVGSVRRPIALRAGDWFFVGPDNGLFSYILAEQPVHEVVTLSNSAYHLAQVSATFHGRDVFSPVAAHLASGVPLSRFGPHVEVNTLQRLDVEVPVQGGEEITAHIVHIDHFGNLITNIPLSWVPGLFTDATVRLTLLKQGVVVTEHQRFFAASSFSTEDRVRPFLYSDSSGYIAIAIQNGDAAHTLGVGYGDPLTLLMR